VQVRENYFDGNAGSSNVEVENKGWCILWKTKVPSKIRVFLWSLARQSFPTVDLLEHRNMSSSCQFHQATLYVVFFIPVGTH
jgi:hypothetical protein